MLESFSFWLIKSCVCNKILHFLPRFGSTEGIRTVVNCLFLSSSVFLCKEIGLPPTSICGAREYPRVVKATAFAWGAAEEKVTGTSSREPRSFVVCHINMCVVPLLQTISIYGLVKVEVTHSARQWDGAYASDKNILMYMQVYNCRPKLGFSSMYLFCCARSLHGHVKILA